MEKDVAQRKESKPRCRVKNILNKALELLDFYFSDVNLNHDRFLRKEIEKDDPQGFVSLSTMLKFNKLNEVTSDVALLAKAVENSASLELNADSTRVRRKEKLKQIQNVDPKTVYVEDFPANTTIDHDWLRSVFSSCGDVTYISLPKYSHNNQPKGFAFIEYSSVKDARKACRVLNTNHNRGKRGDKKRRSTSESEGHSLLRQTAKRRRSVSESSEGSVNVSRRKRKSSSCSGCSTEGNTEFAKGENIELGQNKSELTPLVEEQAGGKTCGASSDDGGKRVTIVESTIALHGNEATLPLPLPNKKDKDSDQTALSKGSSNGEEKYQKVPMKTANEEALRKQTARKRKSSISLESEDKKVTKSSTYEKPCEEEGNTDEVLSKQHDHRDKGRADKRKISETETEEIEEKKAKTHSPVMSECLATPTSENDEHGTREGKQGKKNRQHKKKKKEKSPDVPKIPSLHVIVKTEWLSLKKEYKRLQHIKVSELKRNMKVLKIEQVRRKELEEKISKTITTKSEPNEQVGEREKEKENLESPLTESKVGPDIINQSKGLNLSTGTVVALKTCSHSLTRSEIKTTLCMYAEVAYVDYVDGVFQGFVRFASNADLEKVMSLDEKEMAYCAFQLRKLTDEEEKEYFLRAEEKRLKKYDKTQKKRRKKQRGIDKVNDSVDRISNHVYFG